MALNLAKGFEDAPDNAFICLYFDVSEIICIFAELLSVLSPLLDDKEAMI